ncbi:S9 family peptidase [Sphingorhabdus sp. Alg239-R122]|uniref:S9 family peptidase n=1 Tax=Sphingorhabdus sp. Alg239-R122 TaxID=2305989 RepID=UPI0013DD304D|nr:S9 family peptidase [Sphingorhabdus sp. Alg239-R122]
MKRYTIHAAMVAIPAMIVATPALARPMTAEDVLKVEQVAEIALTADGSQMVIGVSKAPDIANGEDNGRAERTMHVASTRSGGANAARAFLPEDMNVRSLAYSPDGRMISFLWKPDGDDAKTAVYGIPVDGGGHRKLAGIKDASVSGYAWAPDSRTLYLRVGAAKDKKRKTESKAGFNAVIYEEEQKFSRLFAADTMGGEGEPRAINVEGQISGMRVSPDGRWLAVSSAPTTQVDDSLTSTRVHIINAANGTRRAVVATPGKIGDFEISPDGRTLSLVAAVDKNDPAATTLYMVDTANGAFRGVTEGQANAAVDTEWMDDGRLAVAMHVGAQSELRFYNAAGRLRETIDPGALILRSIDADGGKLAVIADTPEHPREAFLLERGKFTRWTSHNPWLSEIDMGRQRTIRYTARDGQEVEGVLVEPVGGAPSGGAPTIFDVHGGPEAHESNGWVTNYGGPGQVAAGKGYSVFLPNYRGSTAYGTAFSKQHQNDYAGKEFNDLVDAIGALSDMGITNKDKVGITGGSYGGYASAWGATALSEHFAASVMFVGISNQISKFGTTDIPNEMFLVHSRKWPWENWQGMLERSPIYHVDKAKTPILILHGEDDTRVAPSQSYELYRNIKVRQPDTPVRLVLYPGEGHGNRKAAAQYDYNIRMMRWMDNYLKGPGGEMPPVRFDLPEGFAGAKKEKAD